MALAVVSSQAAREGGVIRRKIRDVDRVIGREAFPAEKRRRGCKVLENAGQYVVSCNREPIRCAVKRFLAGNRIGVLQNSASAPPQGTGLKNRPAEIVPASLPAASHSASHGASEATSTTPSPGNRSITARNACTVAPKAA